MSTGMNRELSRQLPSFTHSVNDANLDDFALLTTNRNLNKGTLVFSKSGKEGQEQYTLKCTRNHRLVNIGRPSQAQAQEVCSALKHAVDEALDRIPTNRFVRKDLVGMGKYSSADLTFLQEKIQQIKAAFAREITIEDATAPHGYKPMSRKKIGEIVLQVTEISRKFSPEELMNKSAEALVELAKSRTAQQAQGAARAAEAPKPAIHAEVTELLKNKPLLDLERAGNTLLTRLIPELGELRNNLKLLDRVRYLLSTEEFRINSGGIRSAAAEAEMKAFGDTFCYAENATYRNLALRDPGTRAKLTHRANNGSITDMHKATAELSREVTQKTIARVLARLNAIVGYGDGVQFDASTMKFIFSDEETGRKWLQKLIDELSSPHNGNLNSLVNRTLADESYRLESAPGSDGHESPLSANYGKELTADQVNNALTEFKNRLEGNADVLSPEELAEKKRDHTIKKPQLAKECAERGSQILAKGNKLPRLTPFEKMYLDYYLTKNQNEFFDFIDSAEKFFEDLSQEERDNKITDTLKMLLESLNSFTGNGNGKTIPRCVFNRNAQGPVTKESVALHHAWPHGTNACFMMGIVNALTQTDKGVRHLQGLLADNGAFGNAILVNIATQDGRREEFRQLLPEQDGFSGFERTLHQAYMESLAVENPEEAAKQELGKSGIATSFAKTLGLVEDSTLDVANLLNDAGNFAATQVAMKVNEALSAGKVCVLLNGAPGNGHYVAITGAFAREGDGEPMLRVIETLDADVEVDLPVRNFIGKYSNQINIFTIPDQVVNRDS